jgi:predicted Zn-dependent protease
MENARLSQLLAFLEKEPADSFLNYALAMEYAGAGKDAESIAILEKLLERDPEYTGAYYHLGQAYLRAGYRDKAMKIWQEGVEMTGKLKKHHALSELKNVLNELLYEED